MVTSSEKIRIVISARDIDVEAELFSILCPKTISAILAALPISGTVKMWDDEIYCSTYLTAPEENQKGIVEIGDLG